MPGSCGQGGGGGGSRFAGFVSGRAGILPLTFIAPRQESKTRVRGAIQGFSSSVGICFLSHASYLFLQTALVRVQLQKLYLPFFASVCHLAFINKTCKPGWGGGLLLGGIPLQYGLSGAYFRFSGVVLRWKSHTLSICGLVGRDHFLVGFPHLSGGATAAGCAVRKGWWAFTVRPEPPSGDTGAHSSPCLLTCQGGLRPENCFP